MALYRYVKYYDKKPLIVPPIFSFFFIGSGIFLLFWVIFPIVSFKLFTQNLFIKTLSPLPEMNAAFVKSKPVVLAAAEQYSPVTSNDVDYTNPNLWYPERPQSKDITQKSEYFISIPELKIHNAKVIIAGDDLKKSLIHYGGTTFPGEFGNTVIFGHSTLPVLFDPADYKSIFSTLSSLKSEQKDQSGSEIFVKYDGITYKYIVYDMVITKPSDLSPLEQKFDNSYLTLITCVPPGTYWERLNVKARLVSPQ